MSEAARPLEARGDDCGWGAPSEALGAVDGLDTLPKLLLHNAKAHPREVAQREKEFGIWVPYSWAAVADRVSAIAAGFVELGLAPGDVVALIGDNRPEWVWGEVATHACRALSLGIYRDALEEELSFLIDYAEPRIVVAEDEEQVDKFLNLEDRIPSVHHIIYHDTRGMRKYDDPRLLSIDALEAKGRERLAREPGWFESAVAATRGEDVAILCTTSGTTANPKLAMWTGTAFLGHARSYLRADPRGPNDEYVAVLPLSWVMEQMYSVAWNHLVRMTVNFAEEEADRHVGPARGRAHVQALQRPASGSRSPPTSARG